MTKPHFLLEVLVIALDPPAEFGAIDQFFEADIGGQGRQPVLGRLRLVAGHSISSHSSAGCSWRVTGRIRRRVKRDVNASPPSRQVIMCQTSAVRPSATSLAESC